MHPNNVSIHHHETWQVSRPRPECTFIFSVHHLKSTVYFSYNSPDYAEVNTWPTRGQCSFTVVVVVVRRFFIVHKTTRERASAPQHGFFYLSLFFLSVFSLCLSSSVSLSIPSLSVPSKRSRLSLLDLGSCYPELPVTLSSLFWRNVLVRFLCSAIQKGLVFHSCACHVLFWVLDFWFWR